MIFNLFLLKDEKGKKSWSLSIAVYAFLISVLCILSMIFKGSTVQISESIKLTINAPDVSFLIFFLPTCFGLYGWRRQEKSSTEVKKKELNITSKNGK
jgi:hypothetical protein